MMLLSFFVQRAANTGSGPQDRSSRWGNDKFEGNKESSRWSKKDSSSGAAAIGKSFEVHPTESKRRELDISRRRGDNEKPREDHYQRGEKRSRRQIDNEFEPRLRVDRDRREERIPMRREDNDGFEPKHREGWDRTDERRSRRHGDDEFELKSREHSDRRGDLLARHDTRPCSREDRERRGRDERSTQNGDSSGHYWRDRDDRRYRTDR